MAKRDHQIDVEDIPHLIATLGCGTENAQQRVLRLLCPCRNRVYDVEVWMAIFRTYDSRTDDTDLVRHRAKHAIDTLRKQARTNPFSLPAQSGEDVSRAGHPFERAEREFACAERSYKNSLAGCAAHSQTAACNQPKSQGNSLPARSLKPSGRQATSTAAPGNRSHSERAHHSHPDG